MKKYKTIIAVILVCVMAIGTFMAMKPNVNESTTDEPGTYGLGHKPTTEMTEADKQKLRIKTYENKYGISEEKRQEYRDMQVYPDVLPGVWYTEAINAMTDGGLLNGYPDGSFHPDDFVTEGQFAKILCEFYGLELPDYGYMTGLCTACNTHHEHTPVTAHWALAYAWDASWIGGYHTPICGITLDDPVWRGDVIDQLVHGVAMSIPKYFDTYTHKKIYQTEKAWTFSDIPDAGDLNSNSDPQSEDYKHGHMFSDSTILTAYNLGITQGIDDSGTCAPRQPMTRAELCQIFYNLGVTHKGQADGYYQRNDQSANTNGSAN